MVVLSYSNSPFSSFECTSLQLKSSKSAMFFAVADKVFKPNQLGSIQCIKIGNKKPFLPTLLHSTLMKCPFLIQKLPEWR
jgi:hypothetical protein